MTYIVKKINFTYNNFANTNNKVEIVIRFFTKIWREFLFIFLYIFILNIYIGKQETTINADGIGYYEYLPSLFIHKDMNRHSVPFEADNKLYKRINELGLYVDY